MKQRQIEWQFDEDCQEWAGKLSIFEFSVYVGYGGWHAVLTEPFHLNYGHRGNWSNSPTSPIASSELAKQECEEYISDRLSELTED